MRPVRTFLRSYRGTHPLGRSALSSLRIGERPCDTLRALLENTARHLG